MSFAIGAMARQALGATSVAALLIAAPVLSRGIAATTTSIAGRSPVASTTALRLDALERRIAELELSVATARRERDAALLAPTTVRAPFVVLDEKNAVLVRIDRSNLSGFARLTVGDSTGSASVLTAGTEGGALQLIDATNKVRVGMLASQNRTAITTTPRWGKTFMGANADGFPVIQTKNLGDQPVTELKTIQSGDGQLTIRDEAGVSMMVAGVSTKGTGVIKMGPNGNGAAGLQGNNALPASEIQGKKN